MKTTQLDDAWETWAEVELYRWQHGNLPGEPGTEELPLSIPEGLRGMATALEKRDVNMPSTFNVSAVLRYAAKVIESPNSK